ncbi:MAG: hypothetical protein KF784_13105 [Fimbriimonadaceae bacterium]|nr:hypothetical protein [Fimbriimonadaceae bacterium]
MASLAQACMWDRDTLAMEMKNFPGVAEAIVGRFERNPPEYYQMRIDRLLPVFEAGKTTLEELDDLAVAYDRIGKGNEAIKVMAAKERRLKASPDNEHQYRFHANLGTFQIHKWLREGGKIEQIELAKASFKHIQKAIEINPDAHFGRERVQLACIEWLIDLKSAKPNDERPQLKSYLLETGRLSDSVKGLSGLIVLGNAWESIDIMNVLGDTGYFGGLKTFTTLRMVELYKHGKHAIDPGLEESVRRDAVEGTERKTIDGRSAFAKENYEIMRENAKRYEQTRTAFMLARFKERKHPDTDSDFWDGYEEVPPAKLKKWPVPFMYTSGPYYVAGSVILFLVLGFFYGCRRWPTIFRIR